MIQRSVTVDRVLKGQLCTGCGLCASLSGGAISMEMLAPGYARPIQHGGVSQAVDAQISAACPGVVVAPWEEQTALHPYWGPYRSVSTGYATDDAVRYEASSGGVLSALLIHALKTGQVDRVIHVRADPNNPTRNVTTSARTAEEVMVGAGSRYTASSPLSQIEVELASGGALAFVGKPCDVSALRQLALIDPRVGRHVPLMLSFFCGGMPSHAGVDRILGAMGLTSAELASFRYRGQGWPGKTVAVTRDGRSGEMRYADSWGKHLSKEVQFRCKICPDAVGGAADVACADAWYGGETGYPSFEEQNGRSLVVARTGAGEALMQGAVAAGVVKVEPLDIKEIDLMQPSQARRKRLVAARLAALVATAQPRPSMRGTAVGAASRRAGVGEAARNFAGAVRRIILNRR